MEKQTHKSLSEEQEAAEGSEVNAPGSTAGSIRLAQREVTAEMNKNHHPTQHGRGRGVLGLA